MAVARTAEVGRQLYAAAMSARDTVCEKASAFGQKCDEALEPYDDAIDR